MPVIEVSCPLCGKINIINMKLLEPMKGGFLEMLEQIVEDVGIKHYCRAIPFIGNEKYRHYWAQNAFFEKVARMEANDKKAREQRMITDAGYINELIAKGLIHIGGSK